MILISVTADTAEFSKGAGEKDMKTRIISAAVMIAVVVAVLTVGKLYFPIVITAFIALICAAGIYELLHNAAKIEQKALNLVSAVYGAAMIFLLDGYIADKISLAFLTSSSITPDIFSIFRFWQKFPLALTVLYFLIAVVLILYNHKTFTLEKIVCFSVFPTFLSYAFSMLGGIIQYDSGIYYLLLLINFASICDTGAYFTGVTIGKHKLCPEISPKKTVEGAIGGIVLSLIVSLALVLIFKSPHIIKTLLFTVPLCIVGMSGDLFASAIKRNVGLKDYADLIPGHGGILDRFDSMLLIAPVLYMLISFGVI